MTATGKDKTTEKHTPEPWELGEWVESQGKPVYRLILGFGRAVSSVSVYGHQRDGRRAGRRYRDRYGTEHVARSVTKEECDANARRIIACINACEGISTKDLENGGIISVSHLEAVQG